MINDNIKYTYLLDKFIYQDKTYITTLTLMKTSL